MDDVMMRYMTPLTVPSGADAMASYEMVGDLEKILAETQLPGAVSVLEKSGRKLYTKFTPDTYEPEEAEAIRTALGQYVAVSTGGWSIRSIAGHTFYVRNYQFANYCLTFRLDLEKYLSESLFGQGLTREPVYFTDGQAILRITPEHTAKVIGRNWELLGEELGEEWIEWTAEEGGCRLRMNGETHNGLNSGILLFWMLAAVFGCLVLFVLLWWVLRRLILYPLYLLQKGMKQLEEENLDYRIEYREKAESSEFQYIYDTFNQMAREIGLSREKDIKMYQAQLDNLRLQVNPHMLLNSFNMIYSLAQMRNFECIQEFSMYLVEYFRYVLKETDALVPLEKEMHFVESYTGIQKIRFPGAFTSVYKMEEGLEHAMVPPLLVQNFVENAMKYALIPGKCIEVLINIRSENHRLLISVCDTGSGIKDEVLEKLRGGQAYTDKRGQKHIGIWNCRRRMEVFYGGEARMDIVSGSGEGTQIWLDLPLIREKQEGNGYEDFGGG
ncbi:MAG: histidine kinase [Lachnospiraceae bacterium]|nr:histidine kinase [Lachnospiraceae bacterium]